MRSPVLFAALALAACEQPASQPAPASPSSPAPEQRFQALGTEPFWSLEVLPGQLRYSSPDNIEGTAFAATRATGGEVLTYMGTLEGKPVTLLVEPGECSDGMSDTVYRWKATFTWGGQTERGCARER